MQNFRIQEEIRENLQFNKIGNVVTQVFVEIISNLGETFAD